MYSYASVRRYVRRLKHQHPKLADVMEHPPARRDRRAVAALDEPLIGKKLAADDFATNPLSKPAPRNASVADLRPLLERVLVWRGPLAFWLDDAHALASGWVEQRLDDQEQLLRVLVSFEQQLPEGVRRTCRARAERRSHGVAALLRVPSPAADNSPIRC